MTKQVLRLVVLSAVVVTVPASPKSTVYAQSTYCACEGVVYYYWTHPQYGPWTYHDQNNFAWYNGSPTSPQCAAFCYNRTQTEISNICSQYSFPGEHYQASASWAWHDGFGWQDFGSFSTGANQIVYCP